MNNLSRPAVAALTTGARAEFLQTLATNPAVSLTSDQAIAQIGAPIPIAWGRRDLDSAEGEVGGLWIAPLATEIAFQNDNSNNLRVFYQLVLSDGKVSSVQPYEFWQGTQQKGQISQSYNARSGNWSAGNFMQQRYKTESFTYQQSVSGQAWTGYMFGQTIVSLEQFTNSILANITLTSRGNYVTEYNVIPVKQLQYGSAFYGPSPANSVLTPSAIKQYGNIMLTMYYALGKSTRFLEGYTFRKDPDTTENRISINLLEKGIGYFDPFTKGQTGIQGPVNYVLNIKETNSIPIPLPTVANFCGTGDGNYSNISMLSFVCDYVAGSTDWKQQVWVFLRGGVEAPRLIEEGTGPSPWFPDLARYLALNTEQVSSEQIDIDSLTLAARFNAAMGLRFNGQIGSAVNLRDYLNRVAPFFLLRVQDRGGKLGLVPAHPVSTGYKLETNPITPAMVLNESDTVPGTFTPTWKSASERQAVSLLITYKCQPVNAPAYDRVIEIPPESNTDGGPFLKLDLREFCCSTRHALTVGLWEQAKRIHVTHSLSGLQILPEYNSDILRLIVGSVIQINYPRIPSYGDASIHSYLYSVVDIKTNQLGVTTLNLEHFPVDNDNRSLLALTVLGRLPTIQTQVAQLKVRVFDAFMGSGVLIQPSTERLVIAYDYAAIVTALLICQTKAISISKPSAFYFGSSFVTYKSLIMGLSPIFYFDFSEISTVTTSGSEITGISDQGSLGWNLTRVGSRPTLAEWGNGKMCADWGTSGHGSSLRYLHSGSPVTLAQVFVVLDANYGSTFPDFNGLLSNIVDDAVDFSICGYPGTSGFDTQVSNWFNFATINGGSTNVINSVLPAINSRCVLMLRRASGANPVLDDGLQIGVDRSNGRGWGGLVGLVVGFSTVQSEADTSNIINSLLTGWSV